MFLKNRNEEKSYLNFFFQETKKDTQNHTMWQKENVEKEKYLHTEKKNKEKRRDTQ